MTFFFKKIVPFIFISVLLCPYCFFVHCFPPFHLWKKLIITQKNRHIVQMKWPSTVLSTLLESSSSTFIDKNAHMKMLIWHKRLYKVSHFFMELCNIDIRRLYIIFWIYLQSLPLHEKPTLKNCQSTIVTIITNIRCIFEQVGPLFTS